jgi:predicted Zn-dependent protease
MFERLQQANRFNDSGAFPYLRSHPLTTERIAEARARVQHNHGPAARVPGGAAALPSLALHAMMAGRARALGQLGLDALQSRLQEARQLPATAARPHSLAVLYAGVWSAARLRETASAQTWLQRLTQLAAGDAAAARAAALLAVEVDLMLGRVGEAAAGAQRLPSGARAELMLQAQALLAVGRGAEAVDALQSWVARLPGDAMAWQLLAQGLQQQGQAARAVRADAESRVAQFDFSGAVDRLKAAQDLLRRGQGGGSAANAHIEASIVDTRLRQLQASVREQAIEDKFNR